MTRGQGERGDGATGEVAGGTGGTGYRGSGTNPIGWEHMPPLQGQICKGKLAWSSLVHRCMTSFFVALLLPHEE